MIILIDDIISKMIFFSLIRYRIGDLTDIIYIDNILSFFISSDRHFQEFPIIIIEILRLYEIEFHYIYSHLIRRSYQIQSRYRIS